VKIGRVPWGFAYGKSSLGKGLGQTNQANKVRQLKLVNGILKLVRVKLETKSRAAVFASLEVWNMEAS